MGQEQLTTSAKKGCMGKYGCCNDHKLYRKVHANETIESSVTSTCLSVDCHELKTDCMSNKLLHTKSTAKYIHFIQVKLVAILFHSCITLSLADLVQFHGTLHVFFQLFYSFHNFFSLSITKET
jgi:hypothetical protein